MYNLYSVYGLNLESEIQIPEFMKLLGDTPNIDVKINYGTISPEIKKMISQGRNIEYKKDNTWFNVPNLAIFNITNGKQVIIEPYENADTQLIKAYILGTVLGMVLLQKGIVAIHGGGIVIDNKGYIFAGNKGAGKSTLTTALRQCGYKFIADDICSIKYGEKNKIYPGFGHQKLCEDTMKKLGYNPLEYKSFRSNLNIKYIVPALDEFVDHEVPLEGIFEITVGDVKNVKIEEVIGIEKIQKMIKNIFRIDMLYYCGGIELDYFKKCTQIAKNIKYYKITRPRDVFSINEQIKAIEGIIYSDKRQNLKNLG